MAGTDAHDRLEHVDVMDHAAFEAIEGWRAGYERLGGQVRIEEVHDRWFQIRATRQRLDRRRTLPGPRPRDAEGPGARRAGS